MLYYSDNVEMNHYIQKMILNKISICYVLEIFLELTLTFKIFQQGITL